MDLKRIELPKKQETSKTIKQKEKKIRVVTHRENWQSEYEPTTHLHLLATDSSNNAIYKTMIQQVQSKLNGYKSQDQIKNLYDSDKIIDLDSTIQLLIESQLKCYYCKELVQVLYKHVREPKQWTLERISNDIGHNIGNVEIACLSCNLRRRTMYHERFVFTKQLVIVKNAGAAAPRTPPAISKMGDLHGV
jgi:hypothetical protein